MSSPGIKKSDPNVFAQLEIAQSKTHRISNKDLIAFGEKNSGTFIKIIREVFGGMKWVNDALNERFYHRAVEVINKHNWEVVRQEFKILGENKNVSFAKLVPKDALLLPGTAQYKIIKKYHDDEALRSEVKEMKQQQTANKWFEKVEPKEHWLDSFTYDLNKELDGLLKGDSSNIHQLNEIEKDNHSFISQADFGVLAQAVIKNEIKKVSDGQVELIKDVIKFSKENHLKPLEVYKQFKPQLEHYEKTDDEVAFLDSFRNQKLTSQMTTPDAINEVVKTFNLSELDTLKEKFIALGSPKALMSRISKNEKASNGDVYYKDTASLKIKPEELQFQMDRLNNVKDLLEPFDLSNDFGQYIKEEFDNGSHDKKSLLQLFDKVATKFESFFISFQDIEGMESQDIKDLYSLYTDRINKTEKLPREVAYEISGKIKENGLNQTLDSLRFKKDVTDIEIFNALDVVGGQVSDSFTKAGNQMTTAFSKWTENFKVPETKSEQELKAQKKQFENWLKDKKIPQADAERLYEFYDRVVDKHVYSPEILGQALKYEIENKKLDTLMDSLFPRATFEFLGSKKHIEADPLDLFFESAGKQELLSSSFKLQTREMVGQMFGGRNTTFDHEKFADQLSDLFKNKNVLLSKKSLDSATVFISFAASLAVQGYPIPLIMKELGAKKANFSDYDLKKMDGELDPLVLNNIEVNIQKETERELIKTGSKKDSVSDLFKRDPTALISNVGSTFIEHLFSGNLNLGKDEIQKGINSFAPILNPLLADFLDDNEGIANGVVNGLIRTTPETLSMALQIPKAIAKDQIVFDKSKKDMFQSVIQTVLDANEKYRRSKENKREIKKSELLPKEEWLLFGLNDLSKGAPFIETLSTMGSGLVGGFIAGKIINNVVSSFLNGMPNLTSQEKDEMSTSASSLVQMILPVIPKLKEKHDLKVYTAFIQDLNNLVRSDREITGEEVTEKIKGIVSHFLDNELDQYNEPIYAAIQTLPKALANG